MGTCSSADSESHAFRRASHDHNRRAWDGRVRAGQRFAVPVAEAEFNDPLRSVDGLGWLGSTVAGKEVLCLAAGGGRQGPLLAAAGARVTVVDISSEMLELDRLIAARRGLWLHAIQTSMDDLSMLDADQFEVVIQPVSSCYVPDVAEVYRQVARVCVRGGIYISQHKQPASLQAEARPTGGAYRVVLPYDHRGPLPPVKGSLHRESGTLEYLHRWEQLLGGLCRAGFVVEDLAEPLHARPGSAPGTFAHRSHYLPPYVRVKARRVARQTPRTAGPPLWTPCLDKPCLDR